MRRGTIRGWVIERVPGKPWWYASRDDEVLRAATLARLWRQIDAANRERERGRTSPSTASERVTL